jgi:4-amino-4-deoxy-L-arabinose transferase-like glycosyltransferase
MKTVHYLLILAALSSVIFFTRLGGMALTDPDETFYAQTAKEMLDDGNWITPRIFGEAQYEKPVLYYWLIMLSYVAFGVSEFSARFPSAVFSILGVFGVFLLGKLFYSRLAGFLSAVIIATSLEYFVVGRGCVTDTVLTVFIIYTIYFFMAGWNSGKKACYYGAAAAAALAVLTKGPIGLFIPGAAVLIYLALTGQIKYLFRKVPVLTSFLVFLIVVLPWYIAVALSNGQTFMGEFFGFHNITRFVHPEHKIGDTPVFYFPVVLGGMFPWTVFFIAAAWEMFRKKKNERVSLEGAVMSPKVFLAVWFLLVFIFFSISRTKLVTYILPLFPAASIITGRFWEKIVSPPVPGSVRTKTLMTVFLVTSILAALGALGLAWYELPYSEVVKGTVIASGIFVLCAFLARYFEGKGRSMGAFYAIALSVILIMTPVMVYILPAVEVYESRKTLATAIKELAMPNEAVGAECDHRRGIAFYSGRVKIEDIHSGENRIEFFSRKERVWGVLKSRHYDIVKEHFKENAPIEVKRSGKHVLVTNFPI